MNPAVTRKLIAHWVNKFLTKVQNLAPLRHATTRSFALVGPRSQTKPGPQRGGFSNGKFPNADDFLTDDSLGLWSNAMIPNLPLKSVINNGTCPILRVRGNSTAALIPHLYIIFVDLWTWVGASYLPQRKAYFSIGPFPLLKLCPCIQVSETSLHLGRMAVDY